MRRLSLLLAFLVCAFSVVNAQEITQGTLGAYDKKGAELGFCPLKTTNVKADISGFQARVKVVQEFENNFGAPVEAVYIFPLPENAAVDQMTMRIGERTVRGKIAKRAEARQIYEAAKNQGKTAALLDQERPNIFTQAVANILPNEKITIEISYVNTLKYEDGSYEFVFPMTVGPRYSPKSVKDAANIKPPYAKERAGHNISLEINLDAGVPVEEIRSNTHEIISANLSPNAASVKLRNEKTIPNKDFILRYDVTGKRIEDAVLTHRDERGGFFTMILQPLDQIAAEDVSPKEIVFVLDTSGSMSGFPIEKAKEAMMLSLDGLYPNDTFNLITFAGDTKILFDEPVPATPANLALAKQFLQDRTGGGGTEMMKAIKAALDPTDSKSHVRIVCFMTDGYVGNEPEIIAEVQKHPNARVFSFGIGGSVNRFLLEKIAEEGRGEAEFVGLNDDGSKAAKKFYERVRTPLLTDVSVDWNGLPVADVYPKRAVDLFSAKPVVIFGRYTKGASGTIKLKGKSAGQDYTREIAVNFPETQATNDSLATLWARARIDEMTRQDYKAEQKEITDTITNIGLEYGLLTQYTSFVAVEERIVTQGGQPTKIEVPVEVPEGVDPVMSGAVVAGDEDKIVVTKGRLINPSAQGYIKQTTIGRRNQRNSNSGTGQGSGRGQGAGSGVGAGNGAATTPPVNTQNATVGKTSSMAQIQSLPVNGRNFSSLLTLTPGVRTQSAGGGFTIDGASGAENLFVIDGQEVTQFRTGAINSNNEMPVFSNSFYSGVENLVRPEYPSAAKAAKIVGVVKIAIEMNEQGKVVEAKALEGPEKLREASIEAARKTKFTPPNVTGVPVNILGEIVYTFDEKGDVRISFDKMRVKPLTKDEQAKLVLADKFHIWLFAVAERLQNKNAKSTENEAKFVRGGKADVQITLTEKTPEALAELKKSGFEQTSETGEKTLVGRIALEKLAALAEIKQVRYVLPNLR